MNKRLFPRMAFCLTLITSFLFMPFSVVYADGLTQDSEYWKWWYIENTTDAITDGYGASADNLNDTYNGSTVGQYVYDQTGLTADDVKEYVQQQYDNATGYVEHTSEWYTSAIDDIWNSSIDVATKAKYQAEKALRETVDTAGNTVVNVSSSGYWNNVYNDIFNSGSYNDQYVESNGEGYTVNVNGKSYNVSYAGIGYISGDVIEGTTDVYSTFSDGGSNGRICFKVGNGYIGGRQTWYGMSGSPPNGFTVTYDYYTNTLTCHYQWLKSDNSGFWSEEAYAHFTSNIESGGQNTNPVLQPKQVGFVTHNGIKYPVYSDPSLNPFKINDNGTVTFYDDGEEEPIYVDPSQLTDDGSLDILKWLDNDNLTQNPYNPFGKPWNTQDDGSILGGLFSNLVEDISSIFEGIKKAIENFIDKVIKVIKDIGNIIVDALKSFWNLLIGDIEEYPNLFETEIDDNFDMISDLYDLLLECMGVDA